MNRVAVSLSILFLVSPASVAFSAEAESPQVTVAERFFRGLYGCDASVVRELASPDIVITYPAFEELLGAPAIRGADAVEAFAKRFCGRWADAEFTFHERLSNGQRVVLVWSFSAQRTDAAPNSPKSSWGGISLFRFDGDGKITAEVGEESTPGPMSRLEKALAR